MHVVAHEKWLLLLTVCASTLAYTCHIQFEIITINMPACACGFALWNSKKSPSVTIYIHNFDQFDSI